MPVAVPGENGQSTDQGSSRLISITSDLLHAFCPEPDRAWATWFSSLTANLVFDFWAISVAAEFSTGRACGSHSFASDEIERCSSKRHRAKDRHRTERSAALPGSPAFAHGSISLRFC